MSMLNKRAQPQADAPIEKASETKDEANKAKPDPRAALMSIIQNRAPPQSSKEEAKDNSAPQAASISAPVEESTSDAASADKAPTIRNDPRFEKYFKMLKMVRQCGVT